MLSGRRTFHSQSQLTLWMCDDRIYILMYTHTNYYKWKWLSTCDLRLLVVSKGDHEDEKEDIEEEVKEENR